MEYTFEPMQLFAFGIILVVIGISVLYQDRRGLKKNSTASKQRGGSILDQYSTNFTQLARDGKIDPVIGRVKEVDQLIQILSRKTKNNALLLGEPGVGKTAVVERLARLIVEGKVPVSIANKELVALDLSSLVSGTKYRGELEQRLDALRKEFQATEQDSILFIDEIHQLAQASGAEGGLNPADILKPELARGRMQVIGATTYDEYEQYILPEESLERRFQPVHIHEPSREEALEILRGVKSVYEKFHKVQYSDDILEEIVDQSDKIHQRFLPDKALDILDESGVRARLDAMKDNDPSNDNTAVSVGTAHIDTVIDEWAEVDAETRKRAND